MIERHSATRLTAPVRRWVAMGLFVGAAFSAPARAQQSLQPAFLPANELVMQNYSPEFPPLGPIYSSMRGEVMANHTARLLKEAPGALETFEMLVYMERPAAAADVLRRIIRDTPADAAWAFQLLWRRNIFRSLDRTNDNPLPALIAEARRQAGSLASGRSRAEAA